MTTSAPHPSQDCTSASFVIPQSSIPVLHAIRHAAYPGKRYCMLAVLFSILGKADSGPGDPPA